MSLAQWQPETDGAFGCCAASGQHTSGFDKVNPATTWKRTVGCSDQRRFQLHPNHIKLDFSWPVLSLHTLQQCVFDIIVHLVEALAPNKLCA